MKASFAFGRRKRSDEKNDVAKKQKTKNDNSHEIICELCGQKKNSNLFKYDGHPQNALEEGIALSNKNLSSGEERPAINVSGFTVYDQEGHLVPLDMMTPNKKLQIYMSGYLKSTLSGSDDIDGESVPVKDVGLITSWYVTQLDGGDCITLRTTSGEYFLKKPNAQYKPIMDNLTEKIALFRMIRGFFEELKHMKPSYEDLLSQLRGQTIAELDDKPLHMALLYNKHAGFLCDQVARLDTQHNREPLSCMRDFKILAGIALRKPQPPLVIEYRKPDKKKGSKAMTTPVVRKVFESLFPEQLEQTYEVALRGRCEVCEACQRPDCGECSACRTMPKFGGHGRTNKACERRRCPNMTLEQPDESDGDDEADATGGPDDTQLVPEANTHTAAIPVDMRSSEYKWFKWIGEPVQKDKNKIYYNKIEMDGYEVQVGDYVMVKTDKPNIPSLVARIRYMWKVPPDPAAFARKGFFHAELFTRAADTVLGEVGNPREVFVSDKCCQGVPITSILKKAQVERKVISTKEWFNFGGQNVEASSMEDDGQNYFYSKYYDFFTARFEDLPETPVCDSPIRKHMFCPSCERMKKRDFNTIPKPEGMLPKKSPIIGVNMTEWSLIKWQNHEYKKGCGVFLKPGTFQLPNRSTNRTHERPEKMSDDIYTERYRKCDNNTRGCSDDIGKPFCVGYVEAVSCWGMDTLVLPGNCYLYVKVMYRPENINNLRPEYEDQNVVYWSEVLKKVPFSAVVGPCHLIYEGNIPQQERSIQQWLEKDPSRFYFKSAYNEEKKRIEAVPNYAKSVGQFESEKCKRQGKGAPEAVSVVDLEERLRPLRTLDVFAGCGGLSAGLHRAGVADCRWAVENDEAAAHAYSLNNERCFVFKVDCNTLLSELLGGSTHWAGQRLPVRGEVELLVGGPPCQGFSGMNRFNSRDYSSLKNSLVASFLSYCDYYRPKYFILENVRNFVAFKRGMVLKLTLRALLEMGYQCTFGVLQAGSYGVPQTRRRVFVLAAAPGLPLPRYPEPTHSFLRRACSLDVSVDGKKFTTNARWEHAAPRRAVTVRDALSDLPQISNGANELLMEYESPARSHFQRSARCYGEGMLRDHICKKMSPLAQARISNLPTAVPNSDWRDLPNISVTLSNGVVCKKLEYRYRFSSGAVRGVCACAEGRPCVPSDRQVNTLIPWCLPHTAHRHNQWAGLYGRLNDSGFFSTTVTDPDPMGKQGRVVHPYDGRVVSVRECARSQGFQDDHIFSGTVLDKHRQIGNAVPPPLAEALGREIKKSMIASGHF